MILKKASYKAIKYACLKFHYAKSVPVNPIGYSVFNNKNEWCGVVVYSLGANKNIANKYKLKQGAACELVRMALNGKQEQTSKVLAFSIKLIKKDCPLLELIVSYADINQNHIGTIYKATNWTYEGQLKNEHLHVVNGVLMHKKTIFSKYKTNKLELLKAKGIDIVKVKGKGKYKYIYPLSKDMKKLCVELSKPYPK